MKTYSFHRGDELCRLCSEDNVSIAEIMLQNEMIHSERSREEVIAEMMHHLTVMKESIEEGLNPLEHQHGVMSGGDAALIMGYAPQSCMGVDMARVIAASMAVVETNAAMGRIVAAPTAGASGILPAVLIECAGHQKGFSDDDLCMALFTAGAVGALIAENASIAGASGGCQAETGTAAAMAAAAMCELLGADPEVSLTAAAIAIKNCMGLVCDPVAGLVECPCIKRNAIGAANALLSCDLAMAGIRSRIPFDEVVDAMQSVGASMDPELKETAAGGIAATPTGRRIAQSINMLMADDE